MNSKQSETAISDVIFDHEKVNEALLWIQDILERSTIDFLVIGEIGKTMFEQEMPEFKVKKIEIAVKGRHWTESGRSMFNDLTKEFKPEWTPDKISLKYHDVPIEIHIVHNFYSFFANPDLRSYRLTEFKLPNPFDEYWEEKENIE